MHPGIGQSNSRVERLIDVNLLVSLLMKVISRSVFDLHAIRFVCYWALRRHWTLGSGNPGISSPLTAQWLNVTINLIENRSKSQIKFFKLDTYFNKSINIFKNVSGSSSKRSRTFDFDCEVDAVPKGFFWLLLVLMSWCHLMFVNE